MKFNPLQNRPPMPIIKIFSPNINLPYFNRDRTQLEYHFSYPSHFAKQTLGAPSSSSGPPPFLPSTPHFAKQTQVRSGARRRPESFHPQQPLFAIQTHPGNPERLLGPSPLPPLHPHFAKRTQSSPVRHLCKTNPLPTVYSLQPTPFFAKRTLPQKNRQAFDNLGKSSEGLFRSLRMH